MKKQVKVSELTKEELVSFFSDATYGCGYWAVSIKEAPKDLNRHNQCIEDIWADVLLQGGKLQVIDVEAEEAHIIDLAKVLDGFSKCYEECLENIVAFEQENGDMWDAYNMMQVILFGEVIYA